MIPIQSPTGPGTDSVPALIVIGLWIVLQLFSGSEVGALRCAGGKRDGMRALTPTDAPLRSRTHTTVLS